MDNSTTQQIESIENEFRSVLQELQTERSPERFRHEYGRLYNQLVISHEN
jgi:hypothetical protein